MLSGVAQIKRQFPLFGTAAGAQLHYLDNAATTQTPEAVLGAMDAYQRGGQGPVHRGLYALGERASAAYEGARADLARFIGAATADTVVFTRRPGRGDPAGTPLKLFALAAGLRRARRRAVYYRAAPRWQPGPGGGARASRSANTVDRRDPGVECAGHRQPGPAAVR